MHQPAWSLFDIVKLAGIEPTTAGYSVMPHLPLRRFSLRLPEVGVTARPHALRGYVRTQAAATLRMTVRAPAGPVVVKAAGRRVPFTRAGHTVAFDLPARAGRKARWGVVGA